jgi:hypothetical protein
MAVAHWASVNAESAPVMFAEHARRDEMQWTEAREPRQVVRERPRDAERKRLEKLFPGGLWTGHKNLRGLVAEIEPQWPTPTSRIRLWEFFRRMHRYEQPDAAQHQPLSSAQTERGTVPCGWTPAPSIVWVGEGLTAALWCFLQTVTLVWDHFGLQGRDSIASRLT